MSGEEHDYGLKLEKWFECIDLALYAILLVVAIYFIVVHLILEDRWRNLYLWSFYSLACLIAVAKITELSIDLDIGNDPSTEVPHGTYATAIWTFYVADRISATSKLLIELFQIA